MLNKLWAPGRFTKKTLPKTDLNKKPFIHRELTPTGLSRPRFYAPLHIFPHPLAQRGVRRAPQVEGALVGGI